MHLTINFRKCKGMYFSGNKTAHESDLDRFIQQTYFPAERNIANRRGEKVF